MEEIDSIVAAAHATRVWAKPDLSLQNPQANYDSIHSQPPGPARLRTLDRKLAFARAGLACLSNRVETASIAD